MKSIVKLKLSAVTAALLLTGGLSIALASDPLQETLEAAEVLSSTTLLPREAQEPVEALISKEYIYDSVSAETAKEKKGNPQYPPQRVNGLKAIHLSGDRAETTDLDESRLSNNENTSPHGDKKSLGFPSAEDLEKRYPTVKNLPAENIDNQKTRQIIYLYEKNELIADIASKMEISYCNIIKILETNEIKNKNKNVKDLKDFVLRAYLGFYKELNGGGVKKVLFYKKLSQNETFKNLFPEATEKKIKSLVGYTVEKSKTSRPLDAEAKGNLQKKYEEGQNLYDLLTEFSRYRGYIVEALGEKTTTKILDLDFSSEYYKGFGLTQEAAQKNKEDFVVGVYEKLVAEKGKENIHVRHVKKAMKNSGVGGNHAEQILKDKGIFPQNIIARHLSPETVEKIRVAAQKLKNDNEKITQKEILSQLSEQFGCSKNQVYSVVKGNRYFSETTQVYQERHETILRLYDVYTEPKTQRIQKIAKEVKATCQTVRNHLRKRESAENTVSTPPAQLAGAKRPLAHKNIPTAKRQKVSTESSAHQE